MKHSRARREARHERMAKAAARAVAAWLLRKDVGYRIAGPQDCWARVKVEQKMRVRGADWLPAEHGWPARRSARATFEEDGTPALGVKRHVDISPRLCINNR